VYKLNNHRPFANGRGDTFHALGPDIANRKDAEKARFERTQWSSEIRHTFVRLPHETFGLSKDLPATCLERIQVNRGLRRDPEWDVPCPSSFRDAKCVSAELSETYRLRGSTS